MISSDGVNVVPSLAISLTTSSSTFRNAFQHKGFPWSEKHPVLSAPLSAWNAGRAAVLASPRAWTIGSSLISLWLHPFPVTNETLLYSSGNRLKARTKTSVSGEWTWISIAPSYVASTAWRMIFVSASSWLPWRCPTSLKVALHSLPHATRNRRPLCPLKCLNALSVISCPAYSLAFMLDRSRDLR